MNKSGSKLRLTKAGFKLNNHRFKIIRSRDIPSKTIFLTLISSKIFYVSKYEWPAPVQIKPPRVPMYSANANKYPLE
jgi:hypothetical protein